MPLSTFSKLPTSQPSASRISSRFDDSDDVLSSSGAESGVATSSDLTNTPPSPSRVPSSVIAGDDDYPLEEM